MPSYNTLFLPQYPLIVVQRVCLIRLFDNLPYILASISPSLWLKTTRFCILVNTILHFLGFVRLRDLLRSHWYLGFGMYNVPLSENFVLAMW